MLQEFLPRRWTHGRWRPRWETLAKWVIPASFVVGLGVGARWTGDLGSTAAGAFVEAPGFVLFSINDIQTFLEGPEGGFWFSEDDGSRLWATFWSARLVGLSFILVGLGLQVTSGL